MIRRRTFIAGLGGAAAWPVVARAQQRAQPVIGYLELLSREAGGLAQAEAFRKGLADAGFVEDRNVTIEYRRVAGRYDRYPELAAELVRLGVAVIYANGPRGVRAVKAATSTIPIVFSMGEDPVAEGVVASLNRPGGNVTGFTDLANQLVAKRLGLLCDAVPQAAVIAVLANPTHSDAASEIKDAQTVANARGRSLHVVTASTEADLELAFAAMVRQSVGALIVLTDPLFDSRPEQIASLAGRHAIPAIYDRREFPAAGGLMSYGVDRLEARRQAGIYVGRILKGEKPADLPVQQSTRFEFMLNLKTAGALGLELPSGILAIADGVID
jgi:putative tryptophan/tyrosine transport system substrate-binding protein